MTVPRILLPGITNEQWAEHLSKMGAVEMFPYIEWSEFLKKEEEYARVTISESVMKAAHEGIEAQPLISDIEKAARAIVRQMGLDPESPAFFGQPRIAKQQVHLVPRAQEVRPLWTFFTMEAEAALNAVAK